jgi:undecaprenyl-diphosphatase
MHFMSEVWPDLWRAMVLGIVEGLTEFLPISSTGHLIVVSDLIGFEGSLGGTFEIFIQLGAIVAVVVFYARDLWSQAQLVRTDRSVQRFWLHLLVAFLPAALVGILVHDWIKEVLFSPIVVAVMLIIGGLVFLLIERRDHSQGVSRLYDVNTRQAFGIGVAQVVALIPGTSRSGASIIGGLLAGLNRRAATEFSFYLAIPTLGSATVYDLLKNLDQVDPSDALNLIVGTVTSFVVALLSIRWLLGYIATHDYRIFGWYRIGIGVVVVLWWVLKGG